MIGDHSHPQQAPIDQWAAARDTATSAPFPPSGEKEPTPNGEPPRN
jgi:hypothetical protein